MDSTAFEVKGSTIRTKLAFARAHHGSSAAEALEAVLAEHGITRVLEGSWYAFEIYDQVLRRLADVAFGGAVEGLREAGAYSAEQALSTTYQAFAREQDLARFLDLMPQLHARLHTRSVLSVEEQRDDGFVLVLRDLPMDSEADIMVSEGFFIACAERLGCDNVRCRRTRDGHDIHFDILHDPRPAQPT